MPLWCLDVTLTVQGPVLPGATAMGRVGVDAPVLRKGGRPDGPPLLPGSHVAGKVRHALAELAPLDPSLSQVVNWFEGMPVGRGQSRRRWFFGDFVAGTPGNPDGRRVRIAINPETGANAPGQLQTMELPYDSFEQVQFSGCVHFLGGANELAHACRMLGLGLNAVPQVGSEAGIGFGRLLAVKIEPRPLETAATAPRAGRRLGYVLRIDDSFCLTEQVQGGVINGNTFVGVDHVPGAAIKGMVAHVLSWAGEDYPALRTALDPMRFTHALPVRARPAGPYPRPAPMPLSLVAAKDGHLVDMALAPPGPWLVDGVAPAFAVDWKNKTRSAAASLMGRDPPPSRELRLRTAIDADKRRARNQALFGLEMVISDDHLWVGHLDLSDIPDDDRDDVIRDLLDLSANGLAGLGKTGAVAHLQLTEDCDVGLSAPEGLDVQWTRADGPGAGDCEPVWVVTLVTPAMLTPPDAFLPGATATALRDVYARAWAEMSGGALELVDYFASQRMWGSRFIRHQYFDGKPYTPFVLTDPGSVFVLTAKRGDASEVIATLRREGLPLPQAVRAFLGVTEDLPERALWSHCPYIRHNGYGEIAVNLGIHQSRRASREQITPVHAVFPFEEVPA